MIIGAILHKIEPGKVGDFLNKIVSAPKTDILIGPDYSLMYNPERINTSDESSYLLKELSKLSSSRNGLLIPGTSVHEVENNQVACEAPVFENGKLIRTIRKKGDHGESALASLVGKTHARGKSGQPGIAYAGKMFSVGICGDYGRSPLVVGDVDLVLAYDKNAGFHIHPTTLSQPRKIIVCDGFAPKVSGIDYYPRKEQKQIPLKFNVQEGVCLFKI